MIQIVNILVANIYLATVIQLCTGWLQVLIIKWQYTIQALVLQATTVYMFR